MLAATDLRVAPKAEEDLLAESKLALTLSILVFPESISVHSFNIDSSVYPIRFAQSDQDSDPNPFPFEIL